jgi:hypothetical protein
MPTVKKILREIFDGNVDGVSFIPTNNNINDLDIRGFKYLKKTKYETADIGDYFHILLYKCTPEGFVFDIDNFEAILTGPDVYISNIINSGFFGIVVKKTKNKHSTQFIKSLIEKLEIYESR